MCSCAPRGASVSVPNSSARSCPPLEAVSVLHSRMDWIHRGKTSASHSNVVESHIHGLERKNLDIKEYKLHEAQKQAEINYGVRSRGRVGFGKEGRGFRGLKIFIF